MSDTQPPTLLPLNLFTGWLASGERGLSSEAIVAHLTGQPVGRFGRRDYHPLDPADFRRCQLLLNAVPLARLTFPMMRTASPQWARLVDAWDEIDRAIKQEVPDYLGRWATGSATLGYRLMKRVIHDGTLCGPCGGSGRGRPCQKCNGTGRRCGGRCRAERCYNGADYCGACYGRGYTPKAAA